MATVTERLSELKVENASLFDNLKFCLVNLGGGIGEKVKRLLIDGGAQQISYMSDMVTHVIADDDESADVSEAREIFEKPVVTSLWVILSVKCNVLLPVEGFSPDSEQLFSSVVACPSNLSSKDCHTLWALLTYHGGRFKLKFDKSITHLIASLPQGKKYEKALSQGVKIVTPDWALDSINNKMKCDEELYHTNLLVFPKSPSPPPPSPPAPHFPAHSVAPPAPPSAVCPVEQPRPTITSLGPVPPVVTTVSYPLPVANQVTPPAAPVSQFMQQPAVSLVRQHLPEGVTASVQPQTSAGMTQKVLWQGRLPAAEHPQQTQVVTAISSAPEGIRTTMNWQHRPPQTVLTSAAGGANPRVWQQLVTQGRLTPQQQMILQQKWARQQQVNRQAAVQRLQAPNQQIQLTQQQRLQLSNQQIQISQGQPVISQQLHIQARNPHPNQQVPLVHKRLPRPGQQIQISQAKMQQISNQLNTQGQVPQSQQLQLAQVRKAQIANVQMNLHLQQQASQQRMQLVQHVRQAPPSPQISANDQTQLNQPKNVPLYQLVSQQQVSGQISQPSQFAGQLSQQPQQVQLTGAQGAVHNQLHQQPQVSGQIPQQTQLSPQISQQSQIRTQINQHPQVLTKVSQQLPVPGHINQPLQTPRQLVPQQQKQIWQQQRPQGRVVIQQSGQPTQGIRQIPFDAQQQIQNPRLQTGLWQQKQMILANQQRQVPNRMQLAPGQQRMIAQQNVPSHPPPPYPGKVAQPTEPSQVLREATPQQAIPVSSQQIINVNSAGQIVTPKTKTALANLLNTRLQTGNISPNDKEPSENIPAQVASRAENYRKKDESLVSAKPTIQLYGHELDVTVPPVSCLLGCTFCILGYDSPTNKVDMWKKVIVYYGGEVEPKYSSNCTHVICESAKNPLMQQALRESKRCITAFWLNDVVIQKNMVPPWKALHTPSPCIHDKPCKARIIAISGFEGNERKCLQEMILITGARYTGHFCQSNTLLVSKKNEGAKYKKAIEWKIPVVNVQWLNDVLFGHYDALRNPLAQKYQNFNLENAFKLDYSNIHHLMFAWRSPVKITELMLSKCVERPPLRTLNSIQNAQSNCKVEPPSKRIRLSSENGGSSLGPKPRVMFSGIGDVTELTSIVTKLGGSMATSARDCTHLVMKSVMRTVKLFTCISACDFIITVDWLTESNKQNKFLDEDLFVPDNPQAEAEMGFNIKNTLKRKDRSPILKGFTFYVTPSVPPSYKVLCLIIESGGGKVEKKSPKINEIKTTNKGSVKYIIISTEVDLHLCKRYISNGIDVYNAEVVLTGVMNQSFDLETFKYKLETSATGHRMYC